MSNLKELDDKGGLNQKGTSEKKRLKNEESKPDCPATVRCGGRSKKIL